ncbi:MAG: hypothetical protein LBL63_01650, partial [Clostridiales Family XIII bacterium]|nr:hypothetical protein [Clostridiales Family XIII bacterium]
MKRTAILIIIILLTLGVSVAMLWPFFEPDLKKAEFSFSTNYDGEIYLSESHEDCSFLYKVDKEGNVGNILKLDGIISGTLSLKDSVYFVSTTYDFSQGWSLMEADANLKEAHEVARGDFDQFGSVYTLSSDENRVYLTFTDSAGKRILVLSYTPGADGMTGEGLVGVENMDVHMEWTFTDGNTAVDYVCDGESILALLSTGEVARITKGGAEYTDELFTNSTLRCRDGRVVLLNKNTREVFVEENFPNFSRNRVYENLNVRGFAMVEEEVILLASRSDGSANLYFSESASTNRWEAMPEMRVPIEKRASFVDYKSVKIWIIVVAIAIAMIVSAMIAVYVRRLVVRVCATFAAVGCFMLAVMCVLVFITSGEVVLVEIDAASGN